jgi:hypothetical protein
MPNDTGLIVPDECDAFTGDIGLTIFVEFFCIGLLRCIALFNSIPLIFDFICKGHRE